ARAAGENGKTRLPDEKMAAAGQGGGWARKRSRLGWCAAAVLAAGAMGGCGLLHQAAAPAGMERQISEGERVSAATQAHGSPAAPSSGTSTAGPGHPGPGNPATGTPGPGTRAAGVPGASSVATGTPAPSASPSKVTGRQVTAIGDSVMAASAMALAAAMPGIYIDAKPDREMPAGLAIVRRLADTGRLRPVVVIGLGTNYLVTTRQLSELMQILGPDRKLVLINTYVPDSWSKQVNVTEAAFIRQHPGVTPADWYDTIKNRMNVLWPDHIHPEIPGTYVYARMVRRAVQATRDVTVP
ncbi:MAG TPA: hypothetical protein VIF35_13705, partial [Streptosporangiaceae bacterium]